MLVQVALGIQHGHAGIVMLGEVGIRHHPQRGTAQQGQVGAQVAPQGWRGNLRNVSQNVTEKRHLTDTGRAIALQTPCKLLLNSVNSKFTFREHVYAA